MTVFCGSLQLASVSSPVTSAGVPMSDPRIPSYKNIPPGHRRCDVPACNCGGSHPIVNIEDMDPEEGAWRRRQEDRDAAKGIVT